MGKVVWEKKWDKYAVGDLAACPAGHYYEVDGDKKTVRLIRERG